MRARSGGWLVVGSKMKYSGGHLGDSFSIKHTVRIDHTGGSPYDAVDGMLDGARDSPHHCLPLPFHIHHKHKILYLEVVRWLGKVLDVCRAV